ncbi:MAG: hypothetical protein ABIJ92_04370 [Candidatus Aenigmatarchaeota archaeon]
MLLHVTVISRGDRTTIDVPRTEFNWDTNQCRVVEGAEEAERNLGVAENLEIRKPAAYQGPYLYCIVEVGFEEICFPPTFLKWIENVPEDEKRAILIVPTKTIRKADDSHYMGSIDRYRYYPHGEVFLIGRRIIVRNIYLSPDNIKMVVDKILARLSDGLFLRLAFEFLQATPISDNPTVTGEHITMLDNLFTGTRSLRRGDSTRRERFNHVRAVIGHMAKHGIVLSGKIEPVK